MELAVGSTTAHFCLRNGVRPCHLQKQAVQGKVSAELPLLVGLTARLRYRKRLSHMLCDASEELRNAVLGERRNRESREDCDW